MASFRALVLHEEDGKVAPRVEAVDEARLPAGEVTVAVEYSTLNYKDGMILQGIGRLVRNYPHIPGIDFAGTVERSDAPEFKPGDPVILTGWRVGEAHWGGYAEKARVKADWLVRAAGRAQRGAGDGDRHRRALPRCWRSWPRSGTDCARAPAMFSSPVPPAASAASRRHCCRSSAIGWSRRPVDPNCAIT